MEAKKRNHMLDILKGIFIVIVIFAHYDWHKGESMKMLFPFWVDIAVPVFMMISGYLYSMSFDKKGITTFKQAYDFKFVLKKLIRFYLPFLMIYVVEIVVLLITKERTTAEIFKGFLVGGYGPGSYYVPMMIEFVFLFPLVYFAVKKWFFRAVAGTFLVNVIYEFIKWVLGMDIQTYRLIIFRYMFLIAAGSYMYIAIKQSYYRWLGWVVMLVGFIWLLLDNYFHITLEAFDNGYWARTTCMAACFVIPIVWELVRNPKINGLSIAPIEKLGIASYNIFLVQRFYYRYFANYIFDNISSRILEFFICLVICLTFGLLFYELESKITPKLIKKI